MENIKLGDLHLSEKVSRNIIELLAKMRNREYVYNRDIPQSSCLCEICDNLCFVAKVLNKKSRSVTWCQWIRIR